MKTFEEEVPGATTEFAGRFAVLKIPLDRRDQLRMNRVISGSPPQRRWLLSHFAEPTREVHQPVWQQIRLPSPDSSEPLVAVLALVRRQNREKVDTDGFAIRPVRFCFSARGIIVQPIEPERVRSSCPNPS